MTENLQRPNAETRKQIIQSKRDQLRNLAFDAELEIASLEAQTVGVKNYDRARAVTEMESLVANRYAAAARMDVLLKSVDDEIAAAKAAEPPA